MPLGGAHILQPFHTQHSSLLSLDPQAVPVTPCELCYNGEWYPVPWGRVTVGPEKGIGNGGSEEAAWRRWFWPSP